MGEQVSLNNNSVTGESAIGYIPETTWNSSCTNAIFGQLGLSTNPETNCNDSRVVPYWVVTVGGSGGKSNCTTPSGSSPFGCAGGYLKPAWQTGSGVPSDNKRDLPDVSLFASPGFLNNFYVLCESDVSGGGCNSTGNFLGIGGTSASSPAFAGLMALINQKQGAAQGDPNFTLYKLAATQNTSSCNSSSNPANTCVFNDVTSGTIAMPCATGSPNCTTSNGGDQYGILSGYNATTAYDLATGLGSVNANNLVMNWGNVKFTPSSTALTLNGGKAVSITHGSPISVGVSVSPTSPIPTGDVSLIATQGNNTFGFDTMTLSNGSVSGSTNMLPGGSSYTVKAHYEGDQNYGGSYSNAVNVTVTPETSATAMRLITFDPSTGQVLNPNASTVVYGSPYLLRADVMNTSGTSCVNTSSVTQTYACPTGNVTITDNAGALSGGPFGLNSQGYTEDQTIQLTGGSHNLAANYSGDNSYKPSSTTGTVTVTPASTTTSVLFNPPIQTVVIGSPVYAGALTKTQSGGAAPSGSYIAYDGKTQLPGQNPVLGFAGSATQTASCQGQVQIILSPPSGPHTVAVQYSGDMDYSGSTSNSLTVNAVYPITMSINAAPSSIIYGKTVTVGVTVDTTNPASNAALKPAGSFSFYGTADGNINNPVTTTATQDSTGNWELQASVTFTPSQTEFVWANYSGDSNYEGVQSGDASVTVTIPDFSMSGASTPLAITAGQTATETITIMPLTSYTSTVQLSCQPGTLFPGGTCSISPPSVTVSNSTAGTATLTITTLAPSTGTSAFAAPIGWRAPNVTPFGRGVWWTLSLLAGLAAIFMILLPRKRRHSVRAACGFGLVCLLTFAIGCGGGASNGGSPVPTSTTISASSTKVAQMGALTLTGRVSSSKILTGTITFNSSDCFGGGTLLLQNGMAQTTLSGLPVGTCTFTASYPGDANNLASQSGPLNIAVTGTTTQLQVTGQTSTLTHSTPVSVTIQ